MKDEKLVIVEKAWCIDIEKVDEGHFLDHLAVFAESNSKARSKLLCDDSEGYTLLNGDELTYLNIPVIRCKSADLVIYNSDLVNRWDIEHIKREQARIGRFNSILEDENITHVHIVKRGSFYGQNNRGYVNRKSMAGIYEKKAAIESCGMSMEIDVYPINKEENNKIVLEHIEYLKRNLIP